MFFSQYNTQNFLLLTKYALRVEYDLTLFLKNQSFNYFIQ